MEHLEFVLSIHLIRSIWDQRQWAIMFVLQGIALHEKKCTLVEIGNTKNYRFDIFHDSIVYSSRNKHKVLYTFSLDQIYFYGGSKLLGFIQTYRSRRRCFSYRRKVFWFLEWGKISGNLLWYWSHLINPFVSKTM